MKKVLFALTLLTFASTANAVDFDGIYDNYQVIYSPSGKFFSQGGMAEDRIVLTKKTSSGSGGYSEYYQGKKLALSLGSNFEFVSGMNLIAVHNSDLTFYKAVYKNKKFSETKLSADEVQKLFPDTKIVKISEFVNGKIEIKKAPFETKNILILNDTKKDFYKYSFSPTNVKKTDIAGLIETSNAGRIEFSHYGEDSKENPKYVIKIKLSIF